MINQSVWDIYIFKNHTSQIGSKWIIINYYFDSSFGRKKILLEKCLKKMVKMESCWELLTSHALSIIYFNHSPALAQARNIL